MGRTRRVATCGSIASAFSANVTQAVNERGLIALREHLERVYYMTQVDRARCRLVVRRQP